MLLHLLLLLVLQNMLGLLLLLLLLLLLHLHLCLRLRLHLSLSLSPGNIGLLLLRIRMLIRMQPMRVQRRHMALLLSPLHPLLRLPLAEQFSIVTITITISISISPFAVPLLGGMKLVRRRMRVHVSRLALACHLTLLLR
jgi:hypothetical protein